ncbi:MAG: hypothetical protein M3Z00_11760 [Actinomycetota bacterium]|nr:hypothetical protein [Actinomycetota bacterium]
MSRLDEVGDRDNWRCWLCDEPVDPQRSVNDARGPSVDSFGVGSRSGKSGRGKKQPPANVVERLAHRSCNTKKVAVTPVVPWPARLFASDPAPLIAVADRMERKGGREVVARCPTRTDADETASWLVDRFSRLTPSLPVGADITAGGGQFLVALVVIS